MKTFNGLDKVVKLILLIIPFINYIVEFVIRLLDFIDKKDTNSLIMFILSLFPIAVIIGWIDAFLVFTDKPLLLA